MNTILLTETLSTDAGHPVHPAASNAAEGGAKRTARSNRIALWLLPPLCVVLGVLIFKVVALGLYLLSVLEILYNEGIWPK